MLWPEYDLKEPRDCIVGEGSASPPRQLGNDGRTASIRYVPDIGTQRFWFQGRLFILTLGTKDKKEENRHYRNYGAGAGERVPISTLTLVGAKSIKSFLANVKIEAEQSKESLTTVHKPISNHHDVGWDNGVSSPSRNLNTVSMELVTKDDLVKDIERYLSPQQRKFYANRGIPYRRGYLFHGPPGTGKTSFCTALAGHFGLNVYMLSLSSGDLVEKDLETLFQSLPPMCVVLMEDRQEMRNIRPGTKPNNSSTYRQRHQIMDCDSNACAVPETAQITTNKISLSGLLNCIDGVTSAEGRILILTSNTPDTLDTALCRPGRIDKQVYFGYASQEVTEQLFMRICTKNASEVMPDEPVKNEQEMRVLSRRFTALVPDRQLTPAAVQDFLLTHRDDPSRVFDEVDDWVAGHLSPKRAARMLSALLTSQIRSTTLLLKRVT